MVAEDRNTIRQLIAGVSMFRDVKMDSFRVLAVAVIGDALHDLCDAEVRHNGNKCSSATTIKKRRLAREFFKSEALEFWAHYTDRSAIFWRELARRGDYDAQRNDDQAS